MHFGRFPWFPSFLESFCGYNCEYMCPVGFAESGKSGYYLESSSWCHGSRLVVCRGKGSCAVRGIFLRPAHLLLSESTWWQKYSGPKVGTWSFREEPERYLELTPSVSLFASGLQQSLGPIFSIILPPA